MFVDTRQMGQGKEIVSTVCIIGAGIAGITIARELEKKGLDTCLLESGGLQPDDATRDLYRGSSIGREYQFADGCRARARPRPQLRRSRRRPRRPRFAFSDHWSRQSRDHSTSSRPHLCHRHARTLLWPEPRRRREVRCLRYARYLRPQLADVSEGNRNCHYAPVSRP